jgi:hypothetical protein
MVDQSPIRDIKPMSIGCDTKCRDVQPFKPMRRGSLEGAEAKAASAPAASTPQETSSAGFANILLAYLDTNYLPLETSAASNDAMRKSKSLSSIDNMPSLDRIASKRRSSPPSLSDHGSSRRSDSMDIRKQREETKLCPKPKSWSRTKSRGSKEDGAAGLGNATWSTPLQTIDEFRSSCSEKKEKESKSRPSLFSTSDVKQEDRPNLRRRSKVPTLNTPSTIKLSSRLCSSSDLPSGRTAANICSLAYALSIFEAEEGYRSSLK